MTEFDKSQWAKAEFTQEYRDSADIYIVERRRLFDILKSFYKHFVASKPDNNVLDLGCGDGIVIHELLRIDDSIVATLIDGSGDMLKKAAERLKGFKNIHIIEASFQEILDKKIALQNFNFIVSSLAIHHLPMQKKIALFRTIYSHLNVDGYFLNIDVILAPTEMLEFWYLLLWRDWIAERKTILGIEGNYYDDIIQRYKDNTDNKPDTLDKQLNTLKSIGFKDVDCYYKYGIFTMFGGKK
ncbi:MAG TPA: class I SAM-dependent methyltransferase [Thermodesulfovibrionales bacterium]|nr:class I SAM-dependent methyltransferase [Thermodesulfovibrionales bacterium]